VFVEGRRDSSFVSWFLRVNNLRDVRVSEIDLIEIPSELIARRHLRPGRRGAIITLGLELCERVGQSPPARIACIADRDGEDITPYVGCEFVLFTDYACREMYYFDPRVIGKILAIGAGRTEADPNRILEALQMVLVQLFAIRQTNLALDLNLEWLSFERCCALSREHEILFDLDDFVRRYLNKGGRLSALGKFTEELQQRSAVMATDPRMCINGHDFTALLAWYLNKTGLRSPSESDEIGRMLAVAVENDWLVQEHLFHGLLHRFGSAPTVEAPAFST
jgi:hypothetical protein